MASGKLSQITALVEEYIQEKCETEEWIPGQDWVKYAGPYFDSQEYVNAVVSLLGGWFGLDKDSIKFERDFPKIVGKKYGIFVLHVILKSWSFLILEGSGLWEAIFEPV